MTPSSRSRAAVLIDSNIFMAAEDHGVEGHVHGTDAATLIRLVNELGYELVVRNGTRRDILAANATRRARMGRALERYIVWPVTAIEGSGGTITNGGFGALWPR